MKGKQKTVEVGQVFRSRGTYGTLWEVEFLYSDRQDIPHVRLRDVNKPTHKRTYAVSVLFDHSQFEPVERPAK
jgi:hypothetical protein